MQKERFGKIMTTIFDITTVYVCTREMSSDRKRKITPNINRYSAPNRTYS